MEFKTQGLKEKVVYDAPLDFKALDFENMENDGLLAFIPYNYDAFLKDDGIKMLAFNVAEQTGFCFHDNDKNKASIVVKFEGNKISVKLMLEVQPVEWDEESKAEILSNEEDEDTKASWEMIFEVSESILNGDYASDNVEFFNIELTDEEEKVLTLCLLQNSVIGRCAV